MLFKIPGRLGVGNISGGNISSLSGFK